MFSDFFTFIVAIGIAICIVAGLMAIKLLLHLTSYVIAVAIVSVLVVIGIREYRDSKKKKKPP